jgi:hypothetical protein
MNTLNAAQTHGLDLFRRLGAVTPDEIVNGVIPHTNKSATKASVSAIVAEIKEVLEPKGVTIEAIRAGRSVVAYRMIEIATKPATKTLPDIWSRVAVRTARARH